MNISSFLNKSSNLLNDNFSSYILIKDKNNVFNHILFPFFKLNIESFINSIMENLYINRSYSILVKFGFKGNTINLMSGDQIGIKIENFHDLEFYKDIYNIIMLRMDDILAKYDIDSIPDTIVISYKELDISTKLEFFSLNKKELNKSILGEVKNKELFSNRYLPLTYDNSYFGNLIETDLKYKYIKLLISNNLKTGMKYPNILMDLDLIKNCNIYIKTMKFKNKETKIVIININLYEYMTYLTKNKLNEKSNLLSDISLNSLNDSFKLRFVFDLNTGILLYEVLDYKINSNVFIRKIKNFTIKIEENKVVEVSRSLNLDYIKQPKFKSNFITNPNLGVLDVETFVNSQGLGQVYCIGFCSLLEKDKVQVFYLSDLGPSLNSDLLIINCINSMLVNKYHNYYWYIHNMGKFDIVFIHKTLEEYNLNYKKVYYILNTTYKDGKMLRLIIKRKINNKYIKITLLDSYNILSDSLESLTKEFNVDNLKGSFPYSFVKENNLNYIGETPEIKYYNNLSISEYNKFYSKNNWSLRDESLKYLKSDILGLLEVLDKFKTSLFIEHNLEMTDGLTISRLALNKFLKFYLKDSKIPLINNLNLFNFLYLGYYGGRTEVFKPYGKNLFYYDVNSLYPKVALNNMGGVKAKYIKSFSYKGLIIDNIFGIFKAKIKTNYNYIGLLPIKTKLGLIFPDGEFEGVWPSPELKLAKELGYEVTITEGYDFEEVPSFFTDYITDLYNLKSKTSGFKKKINKNLLNNLLGRFGLNIIKPITKIVNSQNLDLLISTRKIKSFQEITKNSFLVNYVPLIDPKICEDHGLDYLKVLSDNNFTNLEKNIDIFDDVSVLVSALVTSYGRIFMIKIILEILKVGGNVYYTDTDSLVTDIPIEILNPNLVGGDLGQFKLEYKIKEGYFISNKTYCLVLNDDRLIIKCKGLKNDSLSLDDFKSMYFLSKNVYGNKISSITDLSKGSVVIEDKKILLQHDAYLKRKKYYNENGLWIDTKPLVFNNIEKGIIPYNN
ncbi:mitochondrion dnapol [Pisolithus orientalis]|uniref:mitochondrion dnapol n=1 Tax=Pisolithus orientalis TaxID=936130 RepID=UPI002225074F|nr:mitochondrion dnapol [Pisolithus orientalis]KAI5980362.1 mitochondrion dnapol [Pisolithus orientalis]